MSSQNNAIFDGLVAKVEALIREGNLPEDPTSEVIAEILGVPEKTVTQALWRVVVSQAQKKVGGERQSLMEELIAIRLEHFSSQYMVWVRVGTVADGVLPKLPWVNRHHFRPDYSEDRNWGKAVLIRVGDKIAILWGMDSPGGVGLRREELFDLVAPFMSVEGLTGSPGTHKILLPGVDCYLDLDDEVICLRPPEP